MALPFGLLKAISPAQILALATMPVPSFLDLDTFEDMDFPFRPTAFSRSIAPKYKNAEAFGSASSPLHYTGTGNQIFKFELETLVNKTGDYEAIDNFVRFCEAGLVSAQLSGATGSRRTAPSTYNFEWPGEVLTQVQITGFSDNPDLFFQDSGRIRRRKISIELTEIVEGVITKKEVRENGFARRLGRFVQPAGF